MINQVVLHLLTSGDGKWMPICKTALYVSEQMCFYLSLIKIANDMGARSVKAELMPLIAWKPIGSVGIGASIHDPTYLDPFFYLDSNARVDVFMTSSGGAGLMCAVLG
jgi:hypothetical protein